MHILHVWHGCRGRRLQLGLSKVRRRGDCASEPNERLHEQPQCPQDANRHKYPEKDPVNHHGNIFPVIFHLREKKIMLINIIRRGIVTVLMLLELLQC